MKKLLSLLLAALLVLGLCSGLAEEALDGQGRELNIIYLTPSTASQFWTYIGIGIENAMKDAEQKYNVKINLTTVGPAEEAQTEDYVTAFEQSIAKQPDAIITATLAIDATVPKAKEATKNGIVLNFVNCGLGVGDDGAHQDHYNQFYFCSNDTIGEMAGQAFLEAMGKKSLSLEKGIVGINMNIENEALNHRIQSFRDYLSANAPGLTQTDTYYNGNVVENSQANAENIISTYGDDLVGMYSGNNITGDGVALAVKGAGIGSKIVSVAVDSDDLEIQALKEGNIDAIIVQDAYIQGYKGMENAILTLLKGANPEAVKQVNVPPVIINKDNMETTEMLDLLDPTRLKK